MTTLREAAQQALEALKSDWAGAMYSVRCEEAITALRAALAQREHITDGSPCWCEPEVFYTDPETGASVIVHREPQ